MSPAEFLGRAEQSFESQEPETALNTIKLLCRNDCERHYIQGLIYRVQAVARDIDPDEKARLYQKASDAFLESSRDAPQSVYNLILARHCENLGFVNLTHAGRTTDVSIRLSLYQKSAQLFDEAINLLPQTYTRNQSFLAGWRHLSKGKASALLSDKCNFLQEKIDYQKLASHYFAKSAQEFAKNDQANLSMISSAWEAYSSGWSLAFQGKIEEASKLFHFAKSLFVAADRLDLADACQTHINQLREAEL